MGIGRLASADSAIGEPLGRSVVVVGDGEITSSTGEGKMMDWQCCLGRCRLELKPVSGQSACQALLSSKVLAGIWSFRLDGDSRKVYSDRT